MTKDKRKFITSIAIGSCIMLIVILVMVYAKIRLPSPMDIYVVTHMYLAIVATAGATVFITIGTMRYRWRENMRYGINHRYEGSPINGSKSGS